MGKKCNSGIYLDTIPLKETVSTKKSHPNFFTIPHLVNKLCNASSMS